MAAQLSPGALESRSLAGRVALVTGLTSGIGLGIARALASAGSAVVLNGLVVTEEVATLTQAMKSKSDVDVRYFGADMSSPGAIAALIAETLARDGRHDRLVNNASIRYATPVASPIMSACVAAKHGVVGCTKTVAPEVAEEPITCNAICPGYVATPLV